MKDEKVFVKPELEIIEFPKEDVIVTSVLVEWWADGVVDQPGGD